MVDCILVAVREECGMNMDWILVPVKTMIGEDI